MFKKDSGNNPTQGSSLDLGNENLPREGGEEQISTNELKETLTSMGLDADKAIASFKDSHTRLAAMLESINENYSAIQETIESKFPIYSRASKDGTFKNYVALEADDLTIELKHPKEGGISFTSPVDVYIRGEQQRIREQTKEAVALKMEVIRELLSNLSQKDMKEIKGVAVPFMVTMKDATSYDDIAELRECKDSELYREVNDKDLLRLYDSNKVEEVKTPFGSYPESVYNMSLDKLDELANRAIKELSSYDGILTPEIEEMLSKANDADGAIWEKWEKLDRFTACHNNIIEHYRAIFSSVVIK